MTDEAARAGQRYSPDQYGRMQPDPQGDWLLFPHVQIMMMEALEKNSEHHRAALAAANEKVHNLRCDLLHARNQLTLVADQLAAARAEATWPNVIAPPQYDNPAEGWTDPRVPSLIGIWRLAKECGYAVGLHGSLKRDVDLIAAPWTDEAGDPTDLVAKLCVNLPAKKIGEAVFKPQGRIAVTLQLDGWFKPIDLSIMPRLKPPTPGGEHAK